MSSLVTLCTFNVENLFMRYKLFGYWPGGTPKKKVLSEEEISEGWGFLPSQMYRNSFKVYDHDDWRRLTARSIKGQGKFPEILCVQEVESMLALRRFNEDFLDRYYDKILLVDGHDPRLIDVGVLTKSPININPIATHIDEKDEKGQFLFSRDCLEVELDLGTGERLTLFVNHLKSKYTRRGTPAEKKKASEKRLAQAKRVAELVRRRFPGPAFSSERFVVVGDFNDTPDSPNLKPLAQELGLENIIDRLPEDERWTHWWDSKNVVSQIDYILLSPALAQSSHSQPYIERRGISKRANITYMEIGDGQKGNQIKLSPDRFPEVTKKIEASDHCPVFVQLGL